MNAVHIDPSERIFAPAYEPRRKPLTRRQMLAIGVTAAVYAGLGYVFVTQKYDFAPTAPPPGGTIVMEPWVPIEKIVEPEPQKPVEQKAVTPRPVETPIPTTVEPLPMAPAAEPSVGDVMPTTATPQPAAPTSPPVTAAPAPTTSPGVIRNPVWISRPTAEQMGALYPERALARDVGGSATLWCGIRANGTMTDCQVVDESPAGLGFGRAALALARYFRISPMTVDGKAVEGSRVRIPVVFSLAD